MSIQSDFELCTGVNIRSVISFLRLLLREREFNKQVSNVMARLAVNCFHHPIGLIRTAVSCTGGPRNATSPTRWSLILLVSPTD